ncbi:MAG: alternate-type signal peptide domain-containing protein [Nocardioidaceae bacterium]
MKNTLKGSLAALAAAILLLGGAGSLAYWNDAENVPGASISSGRLDLGTADCGAGWVLDGGAAYTTQKIVPGDTLTKTCTIDLVATGTHLGADLALTPATWSGSTALSSELVAAANFKVNGASRSHVTSADDTGSAEIEATISVIFLAPLSTNASQNLSATLQALAITATQTHDG